MECDIEAYCSQGRCVCKDGFHGDGFNCVKDKHCEETCPQHSICEDNQCSCFDGYTMSGGECIRKY